MRRIAIRSAADGAAFALAALAVGGFLLFAARRETARLAAEDYLAGRGVESSFELRTLDSTGVSGRLRIGPEDDPDLLVETIELAGDLDSPLTGGAFGFRPTAVRMTRPYLRVRFDGQRFSFGRLDPLIDEALRRPEGDGPSPAILLEDARLLLVTSGGSVRLTGDAGVADDRLLWLEARVAPARLAGDAGRLSLRNAVVSVRTRGDAMALSARAALDQIVREGFALDDASVRLSGALPYPDTRAAAVNGPVRLTATVRGRAVRLGEASLTRAVLTTALDGGVAGDLTRFAFTGDGSADLSARTLGAGAFRAGGLNGRIALRGGRLQRSAGGVSLTGTVSGAGGLARATNGGSSASGLRWSAEGSRLALTSDANGLRLRTPGRAAVSVARLSRRNLDLEQATVALASSDLRLMSTEDGLRYAGPLTVDSRTRAIRSAGLGAAGLTARARTDLSLLAGAVAPVGGMVRAAVLTLPGGGEPLALRNLAFAVSGRARLGDEPLLDGRGSLTAGGVVSAAEAARLAAAVPLLGDQPAYAGALQAALRDYRLSAPDLRLAASGERVTLGLPRPVVVTSASGARLTLSARRGDLLRFTGSRGVANLSADLQGGGLPSLQLAATSVALSPSGATGLVRLAVADLDLAPVEGLTVAATGRAALTAGGLSFTPAGCTAVAAERIELGANDLTALAGRVCPSGAPVFASTAAGWRAGGRVEGLTFDVGELQTEVRQANGSFRLAGGAAGLATGAVELTQAVLRDVAEPLRFEPLGLTGSVAARRNVWTGEGRLRALGGVEVARLGLTHDTDSGAGGLVIEANDLRFAPDGLQPGELSPIAAGLVKQATGAADFTGRLDWTREGVASGGALTIRDLDFRSPAGPVDDLNGRILLTSLAPIVSAPDQRLTAARVITLVPLTEIAVNLQVIDESVRIAGGGFAAAGGQVRVEPTVIPFGPEAPITGAVTLAGVNVGAVFETTSLADRIRIDAPVSGRVPFEIADGRVRFAETRLQSDRAGRISIDRTALTGLDASGAETAATSPVHAPAAPEPPVNAVQEFAYQALENLAYDELTVTLASRDDGKLGLVFGVRGRHDPPERRVARVPLFDLIRGTAFQRRIPLPSGTGVNLTLDTSLNLDELLAAYATLQGEAGRSQPVQSPPATPTVEGDPR